MNHPEMPIIVQSDSSVLLETNSPNFEAARDALAGFAELVKSPEHFHYYRITPLSLWNAASAGWRIEDIIRILHAYSKYDIPQNVIVDIEEYIGRYGRLRLVSSGSNGSLALHSSDTALITEIAHLEDILLDAYLGGERKQAAFQSCG